MQCKILCGLLRFSLNSWLCWVQQVRTDGLAVLKSMQSMPKISWHPVPFVWASYGWLMAHAAQARRLLHHRMAVVHQSASQSYESFSFTFRFRFQSICLAFLAGVIQPSWPTPFRSPPTTVPLYTAPHTAKCQHSLTHSVLWIFAMPFFSYAVSLFLFLFPFFLYIDFVLWFQSTCRKIQKTFPLSRARLLHF